MYIICIHLKFISDENVTLIWLNGVGSWVPACSASTCSVLPSWYCSEAAVQNHIFLLSFQRAVTARYSLAKRVFYARYQKLEPEIKQVGFLVICDFCRKNWLSYIWCNIAPRDCTSSLLSTLQQFPRPVRPSTLYILIVSCHCRQTVATLQHLQIAAVYSIVFAVSDQITLHYTYCMQWDGLEDRMTFFGNDFFCVLAVRRLNIWAWEIQ